MRLWEALHLEDVYSVLVTTAAANVTLTMVTARTVRWGPTEPAASCAGTTSRAQIASNVCQAIGVSRHQGASVSNRVSPTR